jgi:hypothetical protein
MYWARVPGKAACRVRLVGQQVIRCRLRFGVSAMGRNGGRALAPSLRRSADRTAGRIDRSNPELPDCSEKVSYELFHANY